MIVTLMLMSQNTRSLGMVVPGDSAVIHGNTAHEVLCHMSYAAGWSYATYTTDRGTTMTEVWA
jgi:hypothetical protein